MHDTAGATRAVCVGTFEKHKSTVWVADARVASVHAVPMHLGTLQVFKKCCMTLPSQSCRGAVLKSNLNARNKGMPDKLLVC